MNSGGSFQLLILLLASTRDVSCQTFTPRWLFRYASSYYLCLGYNPSQLAPNDCIVSNPFGDSPGMPLQLVTGGCRGTIVTVFNLFDGGSEPDSIIPWSISVYSDAIVDRSQGFMSITCFDVCCDNVFFVDGTDIYVQKFYQSGGGTITKLLHRLHAPAKFLQVDCKSTAYQIFYSINDEGLYRIDMDGENEVKLVDYEGRSVSAFDYNAHNGHFAFAEGDTKVLRVWDYGSSVNEVFPLSLTDIESWSPTDVNALTVATSPITMTPVIFGLTLSGITASTSNTDTSPVTIPSVGIATPPDDLCACLSEGECTVGCDDCPCDRSDQFQDCCQGLCVPHRPNDISPEDYSCFCRTESVLTREQCTVSSDFRSYPNKCPTDVIGAVRSPFVGRQTAFTVYAMSPLSTTICRQNDREYNFYNPPFEMSGTFASGYLFSPILESRGSRFGVYTLNTESSDSTRSVTVIVQEENKGIVSNDLTVTATVGGAAVLRVKVTRQCNTGKLRWRKDGNYIARYNGKRELTFKSVTERNAGVYEIYLSGRLRRFRRRILRLIVTPRVSGISCTAGTPSSDDQYCICPPGMTGRTCEHICPAGRFGSLGQCQYSCEEIFGTDYRNCDCILFCLQDPAGCQCYNGFRLPDCRRKL